MGPLEQRLGTYTTDAFEIDQILIDDWFGKQAIVFSKNELSYLVNWPNTMEIGDANI